MKELVIFADRHDDIAPIMALIKSLPTLKQGGFDTLFLELPCSLRSLEHAIDSISRMIDAIELFPEGLKDFMVLTQKQQEFLSTSKLDKKTINLYTENEHRFLNSNKKLLELLIIAKENNINIVNIDTPFPGEYFDKPDGMERRNQHMLTYVSSALFSQ